MLEINDLVKIYNRRGTGFRKNKTVEVLRGLNFDIKTGETHALVGESGSGKTTLAQCVLGFTDITKGEIFFQGKMLNDLSAKEFSLIRTELQTVMQDPYASLNSRMKIKDIIAEPLVIHKKSFNQKDRETKVLEVLNQVQLSQELLDRYPHSLSGGQRQRVNIARALIINPSLIVCDEILSALDVSVQAKIISLLKSIQREKKVSYLFITHDFGVVRQVAHRVSVLRNGKIVETGTTDEVLTNPQHEYTRLLLSAVPGQGMEALQRTRNRLKQFRKSEI